MSRPAPRRAGVERAQGADAGGGEGEGEVHGRGVVDEGERMRPLAGQAAARSVISQLSRHQRAT